MSRTNWLRTLEIAGTYTKEPVRPEEAADFMQTLHERGLAGCNVTLPHKETAVSLATHKDTPVELTQAANTLIREGEGFTSPPHDNILSGVSLGVVEQLAAKIGVPFISRRLTIDEWGAKRVPSLQIEDAAAVL